MDYCILFGEKIGAILKFNMMGFGNVWIMNVMLAILTNFGTLIKLFGKSGRN